MWTFSLVTLRALLASQHPNELSASVFTGHAPFYHCYLLHSALLKGDVNCILQISKLGSERLINLFKNPTVSKYQNENWTAIFGLQAQCSSHDITTSVLEKQSSTFPSHLHPNKVKILSPSHSKMKWPQLFTKSSTFA